MATGRYDPYGEEYNDGWEDPYRHILLSACTGCPMCITWKGKTSDQIRAERMAQVARRRAREEREPTAGETGREDRAYWADQYSA